MSRPTLEVADIIRTTGNSFWEQQQSHLAWPHRKVLDAIVRCRTAALGGHLDQCVRCGHQAISFNSCRNRHCPRLSGLIRSANQRRVNMRFGLKLQAGFRIGGNAPLSFLSIDTAYQADPIRCFPEHWTTARPRRST